MSLQELFIELAAVFDGPLSIEREARAALLESAPRAEQPSDGTRLPDAVEDVAKASDAHPICSTILSMKLPWAPPETSLDPLYVAHSQRKVHVELLGPDGLVRSGDVRLGLYGLLPDAAYGIRTHPAEEVFIMIAGNALWKRGNDPFMSHNPGDRSYHPSMMPHATKTRSSAFLSAYAWVGDVRTDNYKYFGLPDG